MVCSDILRGVVCGGGVWLVVGVCSLTYIGHPYQGVWSDMHSFAAAPAHPYQDQRLGAWHIFPHDQYWFHVVLCGSPTAGHL